MRFTRFALVVTLLAALLAAPSPGAPQETRAAKPDWRGTGVVVAILPPPSTLHATRPVIIIHHEPIRGLMNEAMDMPFLAASTDLFRDLRPGDRIAFGLKDVPGALLVVGIERLGPSAAGRPR
jgi:Cu/Ag efflux protein CusF